MGEYLCTTQITNSIGEQADYGFRVSAPTPAAALAGYNAYSALLAARATWKALFYTNITFGQGKISQYDPSDGHVIATQVGGTTYVGTGLSGSNPPQIAVCVTLRTAFAGRTHTGRFYLPTPGITTTTATGRFLPADVLEVITATKAAFAAGIGAGWTAVNVFSNKLHVVNPVTAIDCGDVLDTMRSRRNKLVETRQVVAFP